MSQHPAPADIERVFREEYGRAVAVLVRRFGDIDIAEEAVQDAFATAVQRWTSDGLPPSPAGWIITTARNRMIDRLRREASREDRHAQAVLMHAHWENKLSRSPGMGSNRIEHLYTLARRSGVIGGKVVGAGGGGFLLVYARRPDDTRLAMAAAQAAELRFDFEFQGSYGVEYT